MQGLADGYFVLPYTIQNYLADQITVPRFSTDLPDVDLIMIIAFLLTLRTFSMTSSTDDVLK